jgi:hypothetical protein
MSKTLDTTKSKDATPKAIPEYLTKPVLDTFEDVARFKGWYRQPGNTSRRPCLVTPELFELLTEGDVTFPVMHMGDNKPISVPIIDASREEEGLSILSGGKTIAGVIL